MYIDDNMIKSVCSPTIYKRGLEYFKQGRVHLHRRDDASISAVVDGDDIYNVQIKLSDRKITDYLCTCPYYQTMQCSCKHIVATLKQRQKELDEGADYIDDNDKLASDLCNIFDRIGKTKIKLNAAFTFHIKRGHTTSYSIGIALGTNTPVSLSNTEEFLHAVITGDPFKLTKHTVFTTAQYEFSPIDRQIIDILAENYENKANASTFYTKSLLMTSFGSYTAKRIFPLLKNVSFEFVLDGIHYSNIQLKNENPDILIDLSAMEDEINISVSDYGFAIVPDGSWFFYEGDIYQTDTEWQSWFMPLYHSLASERRTQIRFKGSNTMNFAAKVLPAVQHRHGVISHGIDELVISDNPVFELYFDKWDMGISAAVKAKYGSISLRLPIDDTQNSKIVVRNFDMENQIIAFLHDFSYANGLYLLTDDSAIYQFLAHTLPQLSQNASVYYSDAFKQINIKKEVDIHASVQFNSKIDLLEAGFETTLSYEEIKGILNAVQIKRKFYRMQDGSFLDLYDNGNISIFELLDKLEFKDTDLKNKEKSISKYNALYLNAAAKTGLIQTNEEFDSFIERIQNIKAHIPDYLEQVLRPYQKDGVHWLKQLSELGFGGILADDMGLGKTLQVIAFVCGEEPQKPVLIVTPSALTYNWMNEINRFAPSKTALIIDGTKEDREEKLISYKNYDFIITSYPLLRRDSVQYQALTFSYMFIDEAQYIKNPKTMNARSVKKINADGYFALTGTPIENSLTELWSIFDFIMHGYLYSHKEFTERFEHNIIKENSEKTMSELRERIKPFIMRRMKKDVLSELPEKIENTMFADLTSAQKKLYESYLALAKNEALSIMAGENSGNGQLRILSLLMRLRQICCHPVLFDDNYKKESGKLMLLEEIVTSAIEAEHRILIFSQFTSMLKIIQKELTKLSISCFYLDGATPPDIRNQMAARFNSGENSVFLISLKAGGTGLNLTGADMVIHYDPWWNPAVMDQASDRAYRIGQTKAVQVIKLAARGTIEEKIIKLQDKKRILADGIIKANKAMLSKLSKDEIMALFE